MGSCEFHFEVSGQFLRYQEAKQLGNIRDFKPIVVHSMKHFDRPYDRASESEKLNEAIRIYASIYSGILNQHSLLPYKNLFFLTFAFRDYVKTFQLSVQYLATYLNRINDQIPDMYRGFIRNDQNHRTFNLLLDYLFAAN